jgi:lysylphosphatidylglycerol synthetase-like protein (DUF2156 family)
VPKDKEKRPSEPPVGSLTEQVKAIAREQESLPTAIAHVEDQSASQAVRLEHLQQYGKGSLAYSALQEGLKYFTHDLGFVAYRQLDDGPGSVVVLSDPICSKANLRAFMDEFLKVKNDPIFLHISHETAEICNEKGFTVNQLGVETFIDIQEFNLVGNKKQQLRNARNGGNKDGLKVIEIEEMSVDLLKAFKRISDEWMQEKVANANEMRFLVRPMVYVDEIDVRKFVALKDEKIVGFCVFDPMYEEGKVMGYIANQLRSSWNSTYSVVDYIILEAMDKFKAEGKKSLSLGLSPFFKVDDTQEFKHSKLLSAHFKYAFEKANFLYSFKNLARHKSLYRPELPGAHEEKVYTAAKTRFLFVRMIDVYHTLGLHPFKQTVNYARKEFVSWFEDKFRGKDRFASKDKQ